MEILTVILLYLLALWPLIGAANVFVALLNWLGDGLISVKKIDWGKLFKIRGDCTEEHLMLFIVCPVLIIAIWISISFAAVQCILQVEIRDLGFIKTLSYGIFVLFVFIPIFIIKATCRILRISNEIKKLKGDVK